MHVYPDSRSEPVFGTRVVLNLGNGITPSVELRHQSAGMSFTRGLLDGRIMALAFPILGAMMLIDIIAQIVEKFSGMGKVAEEGEKEVGKACS